MTRTRAKCAGRIRKLLLDHQPEFPGKLGLTVNDPCEDGHGENLHGDRTFPRSEGIKADSSDGAQLARGYLHELQRANDIPAHGVVNARFLHFLEHFPDPRLEHGRMVFTYDTHDPRTPLHKNSITAEKNLHHLRQSPGIAPDPTNDAVYVSPAVICKKLLFNVH